MVKYMTWGKKYEIKKLKSLVGIKENAVFKGAALKLGIRNPDSGIPNLESETKQFECLNKWNV